MDTIIKVPGVARASAGSAKAATSALCAVAALDYAQGLPSHLGPTWFELQRPFGSGRVRRRRRLWYDPLDLKRMRVAVGAFAFGVEPGELEVVAQSCGECRDVEFDRLGARLPSLEPFVMAVAVHDPAPVAVPRGRDWPMRNATAAVSEAADIATEIARDQLGEHPSSTLVEVHVRDEDSETISARSVDVKIDGARVAGEFARSYIHSRRRS